MLTRSFAGVFELDRSEQRRGYTCRAGRAAVRRRHDVRKASQAPRRRRSPSKCALSGGRCHQTSPPPPEKQEMHDVSENLVVLGAATLEVECHEGIRFRSLAVIFSLARALGLLDGDPCCDYRAPLRS